MADISQIKLPNGDTFDLVDEKSGYITVETDPVFSASAAAGITSTDISNWNSKSDTDTKVLNSPIITGTLYLTGSTTESSAISSLYKHSKIQGVVASDKIQLILGNGSMGQLILYSGSNKITMTPKNSLTASYTITLPDKTGTIALTSDIPDTSSFLTSETDPVFSASAAAGITSTDISNWNGKSDTDEKVKATALTFDNNIYYPIFGDNTNTAEIKKYTDAFSIGASSTYDRLTLNLGNSGTLGCLKLYRGSDDSNRSTTIIANLATDYREITLPDKSGTVALISDIPTIPSISLNGSSTTSASFYAPTTAGTFGQVLTSNGSGAPTWAAAPSGGGGGDDIFIAEYGVTTFDAIKAAYEADKHIILKISDGGASAVLMPLIQLVDMRATSSPYAVVGFAITQNSNSIGSLASCTCTVSPDPEDSSQLIEEWDQYGLDVQPKLISGTNIKTINNQSILGSGNLTLNIPEVYNSSTNPNGYLTISTLPIYNGTVV